MFQTKEQEKTPEKDLNEMEMSDVPGKEFKITVIKMSTQFRRVTHEPSEKFNKYKRKYLIKGRES